MTPLDPLIMIQKGVIGNIPVMDDAKIIKKPGNMSVHMVPGTWSVSPVNSGYESTMQTLQT